MFDELEKVIDDAFKPEEKKRVKKTLWDYYYSTPIAYDTHNHQINGDGYMRNHVYDELMFRAHSHVPPAYRQERLKCRCGCQLQILVERGQESAMYAFVPGQLPSDISQEVDNGFCPICGNMFRVLGKIKKVISEVEEWQ